jgi:hypothetical protein
MKGNHGGDDVHFPEPRLTFGIPIIGCPDYLRLMTARAEAFGINLGEDSLYMPASLRAYVRRMDPVFSAFDKVDPTNPFLSKKILVLSGASDMLVPWIASKDFVGKLEVGERGYKRVVVEEGAGHKFTPAMIREAIDFVNGVVIGSTSRMRT